MLFKAFVREQANVSVDVTARATVSNMDAAEEASKGRQSLYERIARGNAMIEAEENAHRQWQSQ